MIRRLEAGSMLGGLKAQVKAGGARREVDTLVALILERRCNFLTN